MNCVEQETTNTNSWALRIDITLSIHPHSYAHDQERNSGVTHFSLEGVSKGMTLLQMMRLAQCRNLFT